ncbi:hypothetical protein C2W62_42070, partial [Candidatus Entotheonella serta]
MIYCFADCRLDTHRYLLHRLGQCISLRPKVFQVLVYLLAHRDRIVSKRELGEQVWSARYVSDTAIENCINAVRQVLGDIGRTQRIIQTRLGYGYRFIAAVTVDRPPPSAVVSAVVSDPSGYTGEALKTSEAIGSHVQASDRRQMRRSSLDRTDKTATLPPAQMAHHYTVTGDQLHAVVWWSRASQQALQRAAYEDSIHHGAAGLALLSNLAMTPEHKRHELDLTLSLGRSMMETRGFRAPEVERTFARAAVLCQQLGESNHHVALLRAQRVWYETRGELQQARQIGEQIIRLATLLREPLLLQEAHYALGITLMFLGDVSAARTALARGMMSVDRSQLRSRMCS